MPYHAFARLSTPKWPPEHGILRMIMVFLTQKLSEHHISVVIQMTMFIQTPARSQLFQDLPYGFSLDLGLGRYLQLSIFLNTFARRHASIKRLRQGLHSTSFKQPIKDHENDEKVKSCKLLCGQCWAVLGGQRSQDQWPDSSSDISCRVSATKKTCLGSPEEVVFGLKMPFSLACFLSLFGHRRHQLD